MGYCSLAIAPLGSTLEGRNVRQAAASAPSPLSVGLADLAPRRGVASDENLLPAMAAVEPGPFLTTFSLSLLQYDDGSGMKREATADDLIKVVEELTRIH